MPTKVTEFISTMAGNTIDTVTTGTGVVEEVMIGDDSGDERVKYTFLKVGGHCVL